VRRVFLVGAILLTISIIVLVGVTLKFSGVGMPAEIIMMTAVVPGCGNEIIENGEECDGRALGDATCETRGFSSGVLSCTKSCLYNVTGCSGGVSSAGGDSREAGSDQLFTTSRGNTAMTTLFTDLKGIIASLYDMMQYVLR
jgi:hypothetical protein